VSMPQQLYPWPLSKRAGRSKEELLITTEDET